MQVNDSVCFCNVTNGGLRTRGKVSDECADGAEGAPSAREVVGLQVGIDGEGGFVRVGEREVLDETIFTRFPRLGN
jgi:hypothetical protein